MPGSSRAGTRLRPAFDSTPRSMHRRCPPPEGGTMGTRRLSLGCTFVQWSQLPVHAVFQVEPVLDQIAVIKDEEWVSDPAIQTRAYRDIYGNRCRRLMLPAGRSEITFRATAEVPGRDRGDRPRRPGDPAARAAGRRDDLHAPEPLLPARRAGQRGVVAVRRREAGLRPRAGDLRLRQPAPDVPVRHARRRGARRPTSTGRGTASAATSPTSRSRCAGR